MTTVKLPTILRKHVGDKEVSDSIWGFHAQQAAEKLLKAVLMKRSILTSISIFCALAFAGPASAQDVVA